MYFDRLSVHELLSKENSSIDDPNSFPLPLGPLLGNMRGEKEGERPALINVELDWSLEKTGDRRGEDWSTSNNGTESIPLAFLTCTTDPTS